MQSTASKYARSYRNEHFTISQTNTNLRDCKVDLLEMVKLVLAEASEKKMQQVSLSNNTFKTQISNMYADVMELILNKIKASPLFSF